MKRDEGALVRHIKRRLDDIIGERIYADVTLLMD